VLRARVARRGKGRMVVIVVAVWDGDDGAWWE
jgi:hypothetical protein